MIPWNKPSSVAVCNPEKAELETPPEWSPSSAAGVWAMAVLSNRVNRAAEKARRAANLPATPDVSCRT
jgi:hypothetical protein